MRCVYSVLSAEVARQWQATTDSSGVQFVRTVKFEPDTQGTPGTLCICEVGAKEAEQTSSFTLERLFCGELLVINSDEDGQEGWEGVMTSDGSQIVGRMGNSDSFTAVRVQTDEELMRNSKAVTPTVADDQGEPESEDVKLTGSTNAACHYQMDAKKGQSLRWDLDVMPKQGKVRFLCAFLAIYSHWEKSDEILRYLRPQMKKVV